MDNAELLERLKGLEENHAILAEHLKIELPRLVERLETLEKEVARLKL